ncbi:ABC transporter permease [Xinfangfangia sp. CPCC 101601]|uniref:ABC transporter permease n=1 Tax=Pseudogemmobacter lacusdianii TaxID=3069608 RepID=A0ABU0VZ23_9RHOB|nr:ABC transporter permease [Xinfangfangia sp. CPCC 101601]MDQ2066996.1 ABC transporter permease [Xinfangfangia sp. CPCC 101601]
MALRIEPRRNVTTMTRLLAPVTAVVLTLLFGASLFWALGFEPLTTLYAFFIGPVTTLYGISELLVKAVPLIIIACGLAVGFRANIWNIGAEGQLIMGAIGAAGVGLFAPAGLGMLLLPLMFLAAMLAGMAWAGIAALLRARFSTNEILVTLMLTYIAGFILSWLVRGPWRDPMGFNFPQTALMPADGMLTPLDPRFRVTASVFFALLAVGLLWIFIAKSFAGYRLAVGGAAPRAAGYVGFSEKSAIWTGLLTGGAAAGIAGFYEVAGPLGQISAVISPGYGFTAIIVAFIGRLHPVGILLGGLFLALTYVGGEAVQVSYGIPAHITRVFQGLLLFFLLASEFFTSWRIIRSGGPV